jgi:hypothetical protein
MWQSSAVDSAVAFGISIGSGAVIWETSVVDIAATVIFCGNSYRRCTYTELTTLRNTYAGMWNRVVVLEIVAKHCISEVESAERKRRADCLGRLFLATAFESLNLIS